MSVKETKINVKDKRFALAHNPYINGEYKDVNLSVLMV